MESLRDGIAGNKRRVSIPFKQENTLKGANARIQYQNQFIQTFRFPSNGKTHTNSYLLKIIKSLLSFHSLQTGTHIQTRRLRKKQCFSFFVSIPFKRERTFRLEFFSMKMYFLPCFHSLQTGTHIQTLQAKNSLPTSRRKSFHSLQTGTHIQTDPIFDPLGPWLQNAKTKHEVHKPFFMSKIPPKIPQTHVGIDPNTIF